mgnify:CR=1 FL=1
MDIIRASNEREDRENSVKKRLRSYRHLVREHQIYLELIDQLYPSSISNISQERVMTSQENIIERRIVEKMDLESQMRTGLVKMRQEIACIKQYIDQLDGDEKTVLFRRYMFNNPMEKIAEYLGNSTMQCWRIHGKAISKLSLIELGNVMEC